MLLNWEFKSFDELTTSKLYAILALRCEVFVVEQNCPYQDLDGKDSDCFHLICNNEHKETLATMRILPPGLSYPELAFGRIVLHPKIRGKGIGDELMRRALTFSSKTFGEIDIKLSAQIAIKELYERHGFVSTGKEYLEDGIPHVEMLRKADLN